MSSKSKFTKVGFIKSYLLPVLITFLIPGFALWFFDHVESYYDRHIRESVLSQIQADHRLTAEQHQKPPNSTKPYGFPEFSPQNDPEAKSLRDSFKNVQTRYAIFRWMKRIRFRLPPHGSRSLCRRRNRGCYFHSFAERPILEPALRLEHSALVRANPGSGPGHPCGCFVLLGDRLLDGKILR